jgi:hypothetical protein
LPEVVHGGSFSSRALLPEVVHGGSFSSWALLPEVVHGGSFSSRTLLPEVEESLFVKPVAGGEVRPVSPSPPAF